MGALQCLFKLLITKVMQQGRGLEKETISWKSMGSMSGTYVVWYIVSMYIANSIGCIFRNASHSHVIKLLKGSGTNPTLLVSDNRPSVDKRRLSRISSGSAMSISDHRRRSAQFTKHVRAIVTVELCRNLASTMYLYTSLYRHLAFL